MKPVYSSNLPFYQPLSIVGFEDLTLSERVASFAQVFFRAILIVPLFFQQARKDIKLYLNEVITGRRIKIFQEREYLVERVAQPVLAPNVRNVPPVTMEILQKDFKQLHATLIARLAFKESEQGFFDKQAFDKELHRLFGVIVSMVELEQAEFKKSIESKLEIGKTIKDVVKFINKALLEHPQFLHPFQNQIQEINTFLGNLIEDMKSIFISEVKNPKNRHEVTILDTMIFWKGFSFWFNSLQINLHAEDFYLPLTKEQAEDLKEFFTKKP